MYSQRQAASQQRKTNAAIAARYAEEERRRREGKIADRALAEEIEAKRQARIQAGKDDHDKAREFALNIGGDEDKELRQGVRIVTEGATDAES